MGRPSIERRQLGIALLGGLFSACRAKPQEAKAAFKTPLSLPGDAAAAADSPGAALTADERKAAHALSRLAFGPRPGEVEKVVAKGVDSWIKEQFAPSDIQDTVAEGSVGKLKTAGKSIAQLHDEFPEPAKAAKAKDAKDPSAPRDKTMNDERPAEIALELGAEKLIRAISSERQLQEVLVDFWFNHFNVFAGKDQDRWAIGTYEREAIRPNVFGKFRDLLGATTHHPAMLVYLDNWRSVREGLPAKQGKPPRGPNENYARELLELHTLGVDGGYVQHDVAEVARAFTGWTVDQPKTLAAFAFRPKQHDDGSKTILGSVIHRGGEKDGDDVLDLVAKESATAHFIAKKLAIRFVGDNPPQPLIDRVAAKFLSSSGNLTSVYQELFIAPEFWSESAYLSKVKTPFQLVTSSLRALGATYDGSSPMVHRIAKLGEPLYQCQPPTGYRDTAKAWVSAGALVTRMNFSTELAHNKVNGVSYEPEKVSTGGADLPSLVSSLGRRVLGRPPSSSTGGAITTALAGSLDKHGKPRDPTAQVQKIVGLLLGSPEFQKT